MRSLPPAHFLGRPPLFSLPALGPPVPFSPSPLHPFLRPNIPSFAVRRKKLRSLIKDAKADALLVTNFKNVTYLTGFTGDDSYLLVTLDGETLITDPRYTTQLEEECPGLRLEIREPGVKMLSAVAKVVNRAKVERLGIEGNSAVVSFQQSLVKALPKCRSSSRRISSNVFAS